MAENEHLRAQFAHGGTTLPARVPADALSALAEVVELGAISYWETDADLRYTMNLSSSGSGHRIPDEAFVGRTRWEIAGADPDSDARWGEHRAVLLQRRPFRNFSLAIPHRDGRVVHWLSSGDPVFDGDGKFLGYRGVARNVTDLVGARADAERGREMIESIVGHLPCMIFRRRVDAAGKFSYDFLRIHPHIAESLGIPATQGASSDVVGFMSQDDRDRFFAALERSRRTLAPMTFEYRGGPGGTGDIWIRSIAVPRTLADGDTVWDGIALEVTESRSLSERLDYLALHDEETGLANRRSFIDRLRQSLRSRNRARHHTLLLVARLMPERLAVALGGGGFRSLVRLLASRIGEMNGHVAFTARLTDDQFAICLYPHADADEIVDLARSTAEQLTAALVIDGEQVMPAFHIGAAVHPVDAPDAEAIIDHAVAAAAAGRHINEVTFYSRDLEQRIAEAYRLETELRAALLRGEIGPHYQPIVALDSGAIEGAEALARWSHPERGLLATFAFIDEAEHSALVAMLDSLMMDRVCADIATWRRAGANPPPISVNVSASSLGAETFRTMVEETLERHGLEPGALRLEVTETSVLALEPAVRETIVALRRSGMTLAIDDFGTGYSTLATFVSLPADCVKIDKSFVDGIGHQPESIVVIEAVCAMAHAVGRRVVAEGVERAEQRAILAQMGCDAMQGHLASLPLPPEAFAALL